MPLGGGPPGFRVFLLVCGGVRPWRVGHTHRSGGKRSRLVGTSRLVTERDSFKGFLASVGKDTLNLYIVWSGFQSPCERDSDPRPWRIAISYGLRTCRLADQLFRVGVARWWKEYGWLADRVCGPFPVCPARYLVDPASSICLSQRLSHACLSTSLTKVKPRMAH